jgi:nicotinate-nucleotide adenylyltransferase
MAKPIGILGGTFDPVHHGHLRLALEIYQTCALAEVRMIPLHTPSHRKLPIASPEHRQRMLSIAIDNIKGLIVDQRELQNSEVSFTVETLRSIRKEVGQQSLCLIMGMDAFQTLSSWYQWDSLLDYAHIILARRPGTPIEFVDEKVADLYTKNCTTELSDIHTRESGKILSTNIAELDISSTRIRELIAQKQDTHFLLPGNVISFIEEEELYHRH